MKRIKGLLQKIYYKIIKKNKVRRKLCMICEGKGITYNKHYFKYEACKWCGGKKYYHDKNM